MPESGLDQLIETERRLADRLGAAAAAADEIVAAARRAAVQADHRFEAELAAAANRSDLRFALGPDAGCQLLRRGAELEVSRLRSLPDATIAAVATSLLDRAVALRAEEDD